MQMEEDYDIKTLRSLLKENSDRLPPKTKLGGRGVTKGSLYATAIKAGLIGDRDPFVKDTPEREQSKSPEDTDGTKQVDDSFGEKKESGLSGSNGEPESFGVDQEAEDNVGTQEVEDSGISDSTGEPESSGVDQEAEDNVGAQEIEDSDLSGPNGELESFGVDQEVEDNVGAQEVEDSGLLGSTDELESFGGGQEEEDNVGTQEVEDSDISDPNGELESFGVDQEAEDNVGDQEVEDSDLLGSTDELESFGSRGDEEDQTTEQENGRDSDKAQSSSRGTEKNATETTGAEVPIVEENTSSVLAGSGDSPGHGGHSGEARPSYPSGLLSQYQGVGDLKRALVLGEVEGEIIAAPTINTFSQYERSAPLHIGGDRTGCLTKEDKTLESFISMLRSTAFQLRLDHPNIAKLRRVDFAGTQANGDRRIMSTQTGDGQALCEPLGDAIVSLATAKAYFFDLASALSYLHSRRVIFGPLHPGAFVRVETADIGRLVLSDFSLSVLGRGKRKILNFSRPNTFRKEALGEIAACWIPPELKAGLPVDEKADIWSLGVLALRLFCNTSPDEALSDHKEPVLPSKIAVSSKTLSPTRLGTLSRSQTDNPDLLRLRIQRAVGDDDLAVLISSMLLIDHTRRPSAFDVAGAVILAGNIQDVFPLGRSSHTFLMRDRAPLLSGDWELVIEKMLTVPRTDIRTLDLALHITPGDSKDVSSVIPMLLIASAMRGDIGDSQGLRRYVGSGEGALSRISEIGALSLSAGSDHLVVTPSLYREQLLHPDDQKDASVARRTWERFSAWLLVAYLSEGGRSKLRRYELYVICDDLAHQKMPDRTKDIKVGLERLSVMRKSRISPKLTSFIVSRLGKAPSLPAAHTS